MKIKTAALFSVLLLTLGILGFKLSKNQPFCDGSHEGTKFTPIKFTAKNQKMSLICGCKRNNPQSGPYCDGNHSHVEW